MLLLYVTLLRIRLFAMDHSYSKVYTKCMLRNGYVLFNKTAWEYSESLYKRYLNGETVITIDYFEVLKCGVGGSFQLSCALRERGVRTHRIFDGIPEDSDPNDADLILNFRGFRG